MKKFFFNTLFVTFTGCLLIAGLSCDSVEPGTGDGVDISHFTIENFPNVDGSTSNHPMMIVIACEIFGLTYQWYPAFDGTMQPIPEDNPAKENEVEFVRHIYFNKTIRAYNRLIYDSTDVILVANEPSEDQVMLAGSAGTSLITAPIALDGLVFIINSENPVQSLSSEQVVGIFTGEITNWNQVGGNNFPINAYTRNQNSGSQELMEKIVMQGKTMIQGVPIFSMLGLLGQISYDTNAIGYTVYYYSAKMVPTEKIKRLMINGVEANPGSIAAGQYKFFSPVYAVIRSDLDKNSNAYLFWRWLRTAAGQAAIGRSGYVGAAK